jgi:hypothetical protein
LQEIPDIPKVAPWTRPGYDAAVENLEPGVPGEFGLNSGCMFNELIYFNAFVKFLLM